MQKVAKHANLRTNEHAFRGRQRKGLRTTKKRQQAARFPKALRFVIISDADSKRNVACSTRFQCHFVANHSNTNFA